NLGKTTIARRGRAKRRHWREANGREANADHAQNKGGRPGAARRSGPATFDFATNDAGAAARRPPSEWLRRLDKRRPHTRASRARSTWRPSFRYRLRLDRPLERAVNAEAVHPFRELCFLI